MKRHWCCLALALLTLPLFSISSHAQRRKVVCPYVAQVDWRQRQMQQQQMQQQQMQQQQLRQAALQAQHQRKVPQVVRQPVQPAVQRQPVIQRQPVVQGQPVRVQQVAQHRPARTIHFQPPAITLPRIKVEKHVTQHVVHQKHHSTQVTLKKHLVPHQIHPRHGQGGHVTGHHYVYSRHVTHHQVTTKHVTHKVHQKVSLHSSTRKPPAVHLTIPSSKTTRTTKLTKDRMPLLAEHGTAQPQKRPVLPDPPKEKHARAHDKSKPQEKAKPKAADTVSRTKTTTVKTPILKMNLSCVQCHQKLNLDIPGSPSAPAMKLGEGLAQRPQRNPLHQAVAQPKAPASKCPPDRAPHFAQPVAAHPGPPAGRVRQPGEAMHVARPAVPGRPNQSPRMVPSGPNARVVNRPLTVFGSPDRLWMRTPLRDGQPNVQFPVASSLSSLGSGKENAGTSVGKSMSGLDPFADLRSPPLAPSQSQSQRFVLAPTEALPAPARETQREDNSTEEVVHASLVVPVVEPETEWDAPPLPPLSLSVRLLNPAAPRTWEMPGE